MKPTFNRLSRLSQIALAVSAITGGHATAASDTWTADAAGNWTVFSNWASTTQAPDNVGDIATFGSVVPITAPRIVTLNFTPITVGGLTFNNLGRSGIAQYSNPPTNTTLNNNVEFSNSGFSLSLGTQTLTLDTGTPGYNAADLVVIELPTSNLTGHNITGTGGKLDLVDNVEIRTNTTSNPAALGSNLANYRDNRVEFGMGSASGVNQGVLSGTTNLTKTGRGQLLLTGDSNTYSGTIRIQQGLVQGRGSNNGPSVGNQAFGTGPIILTNGLATSTIISGTEMDAAQLGMLNFSNSNGLGDPVFANSLTLEAVHASRDFSISTNACSYTWSGTISNAGALPSNLVISGASRAAPWAILSGDNSGLSFAATKNIQSNSYLGVGHDNALGLGNDQPVRILASSAALQAGLLATIPTTISSAILVDSNSNQAAAILGSTITSGTAYFETGAITLNRSNSAGLRNNFFQAATGSTVVFDNIISSGGGNGSPLYKIGGGTVELNGNDTYVGLTGIRSGTLVLGHNSALGGSTTDVSLGQPTTKLVNVKAATIDARGTFSTTNGGTLTSAPTSLDGITLLVGDRVLVKDDGTTYRNGIYEVISSGTWQRVAELNESSELLYGLQVSVTSGNNNAGKTYFQAMGVPGVARTLNTDGLDFVVGDVIDPNPSLLLKDGITLARKINVTANSSTGKSTLGGVDSGAAVFTGAITLNRDLTVTSLGGGAVTLSGAITGSYVINQEGSGILELNGAVAASGVTSSASSTLSGTGNIANSVTIDGILAPGTSSIGTLTAGSVTFNPTSAFKVRADGSTATADRLTVGGALDISNAQLTVDVTSPLVGPTYVIASYGTLSGPFNSVAGVPSGYSLDYNYHGLNQIALVKPATSDTWNVDAGGNWNTPANWLSGDNYPNDYGNIATFGYNLTAARTVTLTGPTFVGGLVFKDTDATGQGVTSNWGYQIALGANNLILDTAPAGYHPGDLALISVPVEDTVGHYIFPTTGKLVLTDNVQFDVIGSAANIEMSLGSGTGGVGLLSGAGNLLKTGRAQLLVTGDNSAYSGNVRVHEGTLQVRGNANAFGTGTITLTNGSSGAQGATLSYNNYGTTPTFTNPMVLEQTATVTNTFNPFYVVSTDINWAGNISSVNAAASDVLSVNVNLAPYGRTSLMTNLSGDNSGLQFAVGKGFSTANYLGVGSANALGTGNSAYVFVSNNSYAQTGILATVPVAISSKIDMSNSGNVASAVIGANITSGIASYSGLITLNANNNANLRQMLFRSDTGGTVVFNSASVIGNGASSGTLAPLTKIGGGRVEFNGANTYLGTTAVRSGELVLGNDNALGSNSNTTTVSLGDATTALTAVRVASKGNENFGTYTSGTVTGAPASIDGVTLAAGDRVLVKDHLNAWKNGVYVVQTPTSTWIRDAALDSVGEEVRGVQVSVTAGTVNIGKTYFLTQSSVTLDSSGLDWQQDIANPTAALLNNGVTIDRGIHVVANGSTGKSILGGVNTSGTSTFSGVVTLDRDLTLTAASGGSVDFSNDIIGSFGLTKEGPGKVVFSTFQPHSGAVQVAEGVLEVDNFLDSSSVTVASGATLQGIGTIGNSISAAGTIAPGNSVGTLTADGAVSLTGTLAVEINGATGDKLLSNSTLNISGATLTVTEIGAFSQPSYVIAQGSTLTGTFGSVPLGYNVTYTATQAILTKVAGSDYDTWKAGFGPGFTDTATTSDPDNDGLTNQQEYAFGLNPTLGSSVNPITVPLNKTTGTFTYTRRKLSLVTPMAYSVKTSTNLATWTPASISGESITTAGDIETVVVTLSGAPLGAPKLFVRVSAQ